MKNRTETFDVVVCGGGLAGFCAAVSAARNGAKTAIIQDRPVFGGNSSSEVRVTTHGSAAFHAYARETGVISELLIEERARNHEEINENGWTNSVWDMTMYDMAMNTPNLEVFLNTTVQGVNKSEDRTIESIDCYILNAEVNLTVQGKVFIDCTGDGIVADQAGCEWRLGEEARAEFNEPHAPEEATENVMGSSIHFKAVDMGKPAPFKAPSWIKHYEDASFFYKQGRPLEHTGHKENDRYRGGYWWIEIGIPWDTIYENEDIRHELTRHTLGVWDWIKNKDPELKEVAKNYALEWIGQVPGKRESRRIMGRYLMTEHDPLNKKAFEDEVAFGGWNVDLHTPGGLLAPSSEPAAMEGYKTVSDFQRKTLCGPYGIPLNMMISKDLDNLMMAGRNVSATHTALGTVRVMGTTAIMGQGVGTAAAVSVNQDVKLPEVADHHINTVKQQLLRDGCFLLHTKNEDENDLARKAKVTASSEAICKGVGPNSQGVHEGLKFWKTQHQTSPTDHLSKQRGQWIAVGSNNIDTLSVCLSNHSGTTQDVDAKVVVVEDIWDYSLDGVKELASTTLEVTPGKEKWVTWPVQLNDSNGLPKNGYIRLDLLQNNNVEWHRAGKIEPGQVCAFDIGKRMRRYDHGISMSYKVEPAQNCYPAENVLSGYTRPYRSTNLWRSDDTSPDAPWLELSWDKPVTISKVELTFPGSILREYHAYEAFYRDSQCAKDYSVDAWVDGEWQEALRVTDNYQRHRQHDLDESVYTNRLRLTIHSTNGDPSAAVYEIRCYE
ncbi:FAD-dependent oxidoreductase [Alteribacillus sp. YIM 98480]|uniref:FAD-dependent oxidoreductase n=1 Tax=Alteribacillus sp. YIM 98480 TaxID=2606599 RepID=UPI00131EA138|nr:FAD-dependent oxidoreductase [Alteribacillus sp. YIM 98480]